MAFVDDRDALVALVTDHNCNLAIAIAATADYPDLLPFLFTESGLFDCDPTYLGTIMDIFDDAVLVANGVYYNKTIGGTISNPKAVIACNYDEIIFDNGSPVSPPRNVEIMKGSNIQLITVSTNTQIFALTIGGGSVVDLLDVLDTSCIEVVIIKSCGTFHSSLDKISGNGCVKEVGKDPDSTFNGFICITAPV